MPVNVKDYLNSMKQMSSKQSSATQNVNLKNQALLSQLIEAIAYANSIDFRQKTLNATSPNSSSTGRDVLNNMKAQEALIKQLAEGQKLSSDQNKKLTEAIDKFYELTNAQEVNYKKFADQLERFAMKDLPEAVKTRLINDSRDAHIIGTDQKNKEGIILPIIKKIKYLLEDSAENTKQFSKKLFVTLDEFKSGFLSNFEGMFEELLDGLKNGTLIRQITDFIKGLGIGFLMLQGRFKQGIFKEGQIAKWLSRAFMPGVQKGITKVIGGAFGGILKGLGGLLGKFGLKGASTGLKTLGKAGSKFLKKIPLIGTILSIWMGVERWKQKDYIGALLEFGSGIAACFPGVGTVVSVLLDLANLGLDTFGKDFKQGANSFIDNLTDAQKLSIPVIGTIFGISKAIELWKSGDKIGALKFAGLALTSVGPFGGLFASLMSSLPENLSRTSASTTSQGKGGQYGAGSASFGVSLAAAATDIGGNVSSSTGKCALKVGDALERVIGKEANNYRGNAWQWEAKLDKSKYFKKVGIASSNKDLQRLPAGSIALWRKQNTHPYGHIEIADGKGRLISDFARPANLGLYKSNPAGIKPIIYTPKDSYFTPIATTNAVSGQVETSSSSDVFSGVSNSDAQPSQTFDEALMAFNQFNQDIANAASSSSQSSTAMTSFSQFNQDIASSAKASAPRASQNVQYTSNSETQQMTKEIEDTDIALLNSIIFS